MYEAAYTTDLPIYAYSYKYIYRAETRNLLGLGWFDDMLTRE